MEESNGQWLDIKRSWILGVYAIVPAALAIVLVDTLALGGRWQPFLTVSLLQLPIYIAVFDLPHIIASLFTYADKEYVKLYKRHLFVWLPIILVSVVVAAMWSYTVATLLFIFYTMYHVVRQQTGIALVFTRAPGKLHLAWTYAGVVLSGIGYVIALTPSYLTYPQLQLATQIMLAAFVLFVILSIGMMLKTPDRFAFWYVAAVTGSLIVSFICLLFNYLFLTVFVLRFVHDVTAFMFYIAHDHNRNLEAPKNILFAFGRKLMAPSYLLGPLLAMTVAFYLQTELVVYLWGSIILMVINTAHYYLEGIMWKRGAPHRQYIKIA